MAVFSLAGVPVPFPASRSGTSIYWSGVGVGSACSLTSGGGNSTAGGLGGGAGTSQGSGMGSFLFWPFLSYLAVD